jgi:hypothetical protein
MVRTNYGTPHAELGLTGPDAVAAISQLPGDPGREREPGGGQLHLEAAD